MAKLKDRIKGLKQIDKMFAKYNPKWKKSKHHKTLVLETQGLEKRLAKRQAKSRSR